MVYSDNQKLIHERRKEFIRQSKDRQKERESKMSAAASTKNLNLSNKNSNKSPSINKRSMLDYQSNLWRTSYAERIHKMSTEEFVEEIKENSPEKNFYLY